MKIMTEETFGPTLPIMRVDSADEAVRLANDSHYGLDSSVFAGDPDRAEEIARRVEAGAAVVLEIEVQGARQVRAAMPEAALVFIAPPDPGALRQRLEARGTDSPEAIEERLRVAELELAARQEFPHVIVNDEIDRAAGELERVVRDELSLSSSER
jgi:guanylate kinase